MSFEKIKEIYSPANASRDNLNTSMYSCNLKSSSKKKQYQTVEVSNEIYDDI